MSPGLQAEVSTRVATPEDAPVCGRICFDAFSGINAAHGFPGDFPSATAAIGLMASLFAAPGCYCIVAEHGGRIVGSSCLDERALIGGIGPVTVAPDAQNLGVGRTLMRNLLDRAAEHCPAGVRLVQAAFHSRSMALYSSLGFDIREPLACVQGKCVEPAPGAVRGASGRYGRPRRLQRAGPRAPRL